MCIQDMKYTFRYSFSLFHGHTANISDNTNTPNTPVSLKGNTEVPGTTSFKPLLPS